MGVSEDLAWAAGLFEGEGCITMNVNRASSPVRYYPKAVLITADEDVLLRFAGILGCGRVGTHPHKEGAKPLYRWSATSRKDFMAFSVLLGSKLGARRTARLAEVMETSGYACAA